MITGVAALPLVHTYFRSRPGSAASVSIEAGVVAVTGLIAGWTGSAVALSFLAVVAFATAETLAAAFLSVRLEAEILANR